MPIQVVKYWSFSMPPHKRNANQRNMEMQNHTEFEWHSDSVLPCSFIHTYAQVVCAIATSTFPLWMIIFAVMSWKTHANDKLLSKKKRHRAVKVKLCMCKSYRLICEKFNSNTSLYFMFFNIFNMFYPSDFDKTNRKQEGIVEKLPFDIVAIYNEHISYYTLLPSLQ